MGKDEKKPFNARDYHAKKLAELDLKDAVKKAQDALKKFRDGK